MTSPNNRERWQTVDRLFQLLLDVAPDERAQRLEELAAGDEDLRQQVEALLDADGEERSFLDRTHQREAEASSATPAPFQPGVLCGDYRIEALLGEGGSGVVYRATNETSRRVAAIKVLRQALPSQEAVARFRREWVLLGQLEHPNIARLYEVGTTEGGLPYLVLELVEGVPLPQYCDEHRLDLRQRIRLLRQVCEAAQHAHQHLIVHRDIKPSNVLVTTEGVPKLVDFGTAKPLPEFLRETHNITHDASPLTPLYASPEQIDGGSLSTATDVYSLGILAYEVLSGAGPYGAASDLLTVLKRVQEHAIAPMSATQPSAAIAEARRTTSRSLRAQLRGDLDAIVLQAIRKKPENRYRSVADLAQDLGRYLEGHPVSARRVGWPVRAAKTLRRHPLAAMLTTLVLLAGIGWAVSFAQQARRISEERDKARYVVQFLVEMFAVTSPGQDAGRLTNIEDLLEANLERLEEIQQLRDNPALAGSVTTAVAKIYDAVGLPRQAADLGERSLELLRESLPERHLEVGRAAHLLATARSSLDPSDPSIEELLRTALDSRYCSTDGQRAIVLTNLAQTVARSGDVEQAIALTDQALALRGWPHDPSNDLATPYALRSRGVLSSRLGDYDEAALFVGYAVEAAREKYGANEVGLIEYLATQAEVLRRAKRYSEAVEAMQNSIDLLVKHKGPDTRRRGAYLSSLGRALHPLGRHEEAAQAFRDALPIIERYSSQRHPEFSQSLGLLARELLELGDHQQAVAMATQSRDLMAELAPDSPWASFVELQLGKAWHQQGESVSALELYNLALERIEEAKPHSVREPTRVGLQHAQTEALAALGRFDEARSLGTQALAKLQDGDPAAESQELELAQQLRKLCPPRQDGCADATALVASTVDRFGSLAQLPPMDQTALEQLQR